jgi:hypothetical protein
MVTRQAQLEPAAQSEAVDGGRDGLAASFERAQRGGTGGDDFRRFAGGEALVVDANQVVQVRTRHEPVGLPRGDDGADDLGAAPELLGELLQLARELWREDIHGPPLTSSVTRATPSSPTSRAMLLVTVASGAFDDDRRRLTGSGAQGHEGAVQ